MITYFILNACILLFTNKIATSVDTSPSWSADGNKIGFASARNNGNLDIYTINSNGTEIVRLTSDTANEQYPVWSPDGKKIVYTWEDGKNAEIYIMDADGKGKKNLTNHPSKDADRASWFPDNKRIVFSSNRDEFYNLYMINVDGSELRQITDDSIMKINPSVSPDGKKIIYSCKDRGKSWIAIIDVDGNNNKTLAEDGSYASWSKDGKSIIFQSTRDKKRLPNGIPAPEIYLMDADGTNQRNISNNEVWDFYCYFSPDGQRVVFTSMRDGNQEIYTMNIKGADIKRLTYN